MIPEIAEVFFFNDTIPPVTWVIFISPERLIIPVEFVLEVESVSYPSQYGAGWEFDSLSVVTGAAILFRGVVDDGGLVSWKDKG